MFRSDFIILDAIISILFENVKYKHHIDNAISNSPSYYTIKEGCILVADRIKSLRESMNISQAELAKRLGITRSSVNAWELGISVPSTQYIVELSAIFKVSTDHLLCVDDSASVSVKGLSESDVKIIYSLITHLREKNALIQD